MFFLLKIFTLKDLNLVENLADLAETPIRVEPRGVHEARFIQLQVPLVLGHLVTWPSAEGSGAHNC